MCLGRSLKGKESMTKEKWDLNAEKKNHGSGDLIKKRRRLQDRPLEKAEPNNEGEGGTL